MKYIILTLLICFSGSLLAQDRAPISMEIHTIDWSTKTVIAIRAKDLIEDKYKIKITFFDKSYIRKVVNEITTIPKENNVSGNIDVRCACLIHYSDSTNDTLSFGWTNSFMINRKTFKLTWSLLELIEMKLPYCMLYTYNIFKSYLINNIYFEND